MLEINRRHADVTELLPVRRSVNIEQSRMLIRPDKLLAAVAFAGHAETLPSYRPLGAFRVDEDFHLESLYPLLLSLLLLL